MNDQVRNGNSNDAVAGGAPGEAEATLRLIASLPPPRDWRSAFTPAWRRLRAGDVFWPGPRRSTLGAPGCVRRPRRRLFLWLWAADGGCIRVFLMRSRQGALFLRRAGPRRAASRLPGHAHAANPQWTGGGASAGGPAGRGQARCKGAAPIVRNAPKPPNRASSASAEVTRIHVALQPAK